MSPTVSVIPVEASPLREILVTGAGVRIVTNECVDIRLVGGKPLAIHGADIGSSENMVAKVKMMIVVVSVAKVGPR